MQTPIGGPRLALLLIGGDISISSCYTGPVVADTSKPVLAPRLERCTLPQWCDDSRVTQLRSASGEGSRLTLGKHTGRSHFLCSPQPSLWWPSNIRAEHSK